VAKKVQAMVKLQIAAGKATPAPPVGTALGPHGVNIMDFCKNFNAKTAGQEGLIIPAVVTIYADRSYTFITKTPPASILLKRAANIAKGSAEPNKSKVGTVTQKQALRALLVVEMLVDVDRALGAPDRIDHEIVAELLHAEHVGQDVVGDAALPLRSHASREGYRSILDGDDDVVDVEAVVRRQPLAHEIADLAIVELIKVLQVLVVARHRSPSV